MSNYSYTKSSASDGVVVHALKTSPNNIILKPSRTAVCSQPKVAVNGGFFNFGDGALLSIAVQNDVPVAGKRGAYGSGSSQMRCKDVQLRGDGRRVYSIVTIDKSE